MTYVDGINALEWTCFGIGLIVGIVAGMAGTWLLNGAVRLLLEDSDES